MLPQDESTSRVSIIKVHNNNIRQTDLNTITRSRIDIMTNSINYTLKFMEYAVTALTSSS